RPTMTSRVPAVAQNNKQHFFKQKLRCEPISSMASKPELVRAQPSLAGLKGSE
ncbi:9391_t:CDS:1, partial [Ambispora gerdemannii]